MAARTLASTVPTSADVVYLDTSAIVPLAFAEGKQAIAREAERARRLSPFLRKVVAEGGKLRTTILAIEEIAAKARNTARRKASPDENWEALRRNDPATAAAVDAAAHAKMLKMLEWTAQALGHANVKLESASVPPEETLTAGEKLRKHHRELLRVYARLDAMDALHIIFGARIGATAYISFDDAWADVNEIVVLR